MKPFLFFLFAVFCASASAQTNWYHLPKAPVCLSSGGSLGGRFSDIYFVTDSIGWIFGGGYYESGIYKTSDAGNTWVIQVDSISGERSIEFLDEFEGFAGTVSAFTPNAKVFHTTNGGETWNRILHPAFDSIMGICGISHFHNHVFMCGAYNGTPKFFKSTDRGDTWSMIKLDSLATGLVDCHFFNESVGLVTGRSLNGGVILKTTNGGLNWKVAAYTGGQSTNYVWKLQFTSPLVGYASVEDTINGKAHFFKTTDGGDSWTLHELEGVYRFGIQGIWFANDTLGWIGGWTSGLFETRDGGGKWQYIPAGGNFNRFFHTPSGKLYAAGNSIFTYDPLHSALPDTSEPHEITVHTLHPVFPNPAASSVTVSYDLGTTTGVKLELLESSGKIVSVLKQEEQGKGHYEMEVSLAQFANGIYHLILLTHETHHSQKIILNK